MYSIMDQTKSLHSNKMFWRLMLFKVYHRTKICTNIYHLLMDFKWNTLSTSFDHVLNSYSILLCQSIKLIEAIYLYLFFVWVFVSKHWWCIHRNGYYKYYGTMNLQWYEVWGVRIILYIVNFCSYSKIKKKEVWI